jgi:alpha-amylase
MSPSPLPYTFCFLSFEGPDLYAQAGGLSVRITQLATHLAENGYKSHLFFVGDPDEPGREERVNGRLTLHRWCQWISAYHPGGVYAGEDEKLADFANSIPSFVIDEIVRPALEHDCIPVVMAEEWHTADTLIRLHDQLSTEGLRERCLLFWNANNTMSFHRVDWDRLPQAATLTAVSRYMKHIMWDWGVNPLVIPNGIPERLLTPVPRDRIQNLRGTLDLTEESILLFKVGRFDPAKRWLMAIDTAARLKAQGVHVAFVLSGGVESHGHEVFERARFQGLSIHHLSASPDSLDGLLSALDDAPSADIYNLPFTLSEEMLRVFYAAADAVLANSGHEPFGLVGLEAMAAGGIAFTGTTGEEYATGGGAFALDTDQPSEIVTPLLHLHAHPDEARARRSAARRKAADFTWDRVSDVLFRKLNDLAVQQGLLTFSPDHTLMPTPRVQDVVIYTVVHQPRRLRLPAEPVSTSDSQEKIEASLFDDEMNERYFRNVAAASYWPATERFLRLVDDGLKLSIGFSLSFIEQAERWDPALLDRFRMLVQHENVELVAVEPTHSFVLLWDLPFFIERMQAVRDRLETTFGERPVVADTTEMMMSDGIYHALEQAGFRAGLVDGRSWVLEWRRPTYIYHHGEGRPKLLTRHYTLSDDVGYRFSNRGWDGWPLMADDYVQWIADSPGKVAVLGWDFETFGEHHPPESGIFEFIDALPRAIHNAGLSFATPSEALDRHGDDSYDLPLSPFPSTWAGSGGLEFFLGNAAQQAVHMLMIQTYQKARLTGNDTWIDLATWLAQSDNLHLIQWYGRSGSEAEVSAYFTPHEWWSLGPDGIIWELQQVYKHIIDALDAELPSGGRKPRDNEGTVVPDSHVSLREPPRTPAPPERR